MKSNTNKSTKSVKATAIATEMTVSDFSQTHRDTLNAVLIVSLTINLFVLVGWVALQVTSAYDSQVAALLFTR
jgi:hypothetical protein